jgi:hypothetical protein
MKLFNTIVLNYVHAYLKAPVKWGQRVFGQQMPTKSDVRRAFLKDLTMLAETAQLMDDQKVLAKIKQYTEDNFDQEIKALQSSYTSTD